MKMNKLNGGAMAVMVAGLFAVTALSATPADKMDKGSSAEVKCMNSSSCKGHGACKQAKARTPARARASRCRKTSSLATPPSLTQRKPLKVTSGVF
ncbi:hypothetical protein [Dyella silvatica]|uniref:hypothetical protein n=1 Tax=Dyella silvatica TaxID=2992128 RepID=UPI00224E3773|nr:hypothetical protein [Dyella silvatica]